MGLLEKLWDDTVAGPRPDSGLGRLRKFSTFSFRSSSDKDGDNNSEEKMKVTRSITIVRPSPPGNNNQTAGSAPVSPAGDTPPPSPFSGSRSGAFRFRRRSTSDAYEKAASQDGARSPPSPYDV